MTPEAHRGLNHLLDLAIEEDLGPGGDVTSALTIAAGSKGHGDIIAKEFLVVCGVEAARVTFARFDAGLVVDAKRPDGVVVDEGEPVLNVSGSLRSLLAAERTALNVMQRLSGIATLTRLFVDAVPNDSSTQIVDTRKTTPGWRALQKYAVRCGGGRNHRMGLNDGILIKDNHIAAAGSVTKAIERAKAEAHHLLKIECEVTSQPELVEALDAGAHVILLDNMDDEQLAAAVKAAREHTPGVVLEASGNMTLERIPAVAATGVDLISVGALTHSAPAADLSLEIR